jgi:hypothetical protein
MTSEPYIVHIADDSELAPLLEGGDLTSLRLEHNGVLFRVSREDAADAGVGAGTPGDEALQHLERAIGSWKKAGVDAEAFKEYIRERRKTRNRPSVRL